jgi:hypothetical protein
VKGDVVIASHPGQPGLVNGDSGNVTLGAFASTVEIDGDVYVQSADAAAGGKSGFVLVGPDPYTHPTPDNYYAAAASIYVKGSHIPPHKTSTGC